MKLDLIRKEFTTISTIGDLLIDGKFFCYTLEDAIRDKKIPNETAIPCGRYEVITNYSVRFKKVMPLILNVPGFTGVRIHAGNTKADTSGCVLLGNTRGEDFIGGSRHAMKAFMPKLQEGLKAGKVTLIIREIGGDHGRDPDKTDQC